MIFAPFAYKQSRVAAPAPPSTATLEISNDDAALNNCAWEKNGITQASIPSNTTFSTTLNVGDTFYVYASSVSFGATIEYSLNGTFITSYSGDPVAQTPLFTTEASNIYRFSCYSGF